MSWKIVTFSEGKKRVKEIGSEDMHSISSLIYGWITIKMK